jgi:hypothetical protein
MNKNFSANNVKGPSGTVPKTNPNPSNTVPISNNVFSQAPLPKGINIVPIPNNDLDKPVEVKKVRRQLLKLDENVLFYEENGIKKYYDVIMKTEFKDKYSDVKLYINVIFLLGK